MKQLFYAIIKKYARLRRLSRFACTIFLRIRYFLIAASVKTDKKTVLFGSFNGKSYCDSPKIIYLRMLSDRRFADYRYIWIFSEPEKYAFLEEHPNTRVVRAKGFMYARALKASGMWITNFRIDYYVPSHRQRYVQCWHGTPLKKIGFDIEYCDNSLNSVTEFREKYLIEAKKFTHIVSASPFATEKLISAFHLRELNKEKAVLEIGYPRNDALYRYTAKEEAAIRSSLRLPDDKKIILYAPTWRDNDFDASTGYCFKPQADFGLLQEQFKDSAVILFRAHYLITNKIDFNNYRGFIYDVSDYDDIADLYIISDVLITDYSSVFFDYANLSRPIVFYMYDLENYNGQIRDFYFPLTELPGEIIKVSGELIDALKMALGGDFQPDARYLRFKEKFNPFDDGNAAGRLIDILFYNS